MSYSDEVDRLKEDADELAVRMSIVLSLILTLAAAAILSKHQLTNYPWVNVAALTVPLFMARSVILIDQSRQLFSPFEFRERSAILSWTG